MRQQVTDVGADNERLRAKIDRLRSRIAHLHSVLSEHRLGPCRLYGVAASSPSSVDADTTLGF